MGPRQYCVARGHHDRLKVLVRMGPIGTMTIPGDTETPPEPDSITGTVTRSRQH